MKNVVQSSQIEKLIVEIRNQRVIIDKDVAMLYGVETKEINRAVKNNLDKFPKGYVITLNDREAEEVVKNFHHLDNLRFSHATTKAFTEKGLYMLATILHSPIATQTTIAIVETFAKIRELSRAVAELANIKDKEKQKPLMQKSGEIISDILDDGLHVFA